jgi:4-diphosphocytidyl-2-C-methyl-D-erythritol kinase
MIIHAHAKINLGLHIVAKRNDGFHNIETIFHHIGLSDILTVKRSEKIEITCTNPDIPVDSSNLCWKAVEAFQHHHSITDGVQIQIDKNIPVGAGLGGGSSDAAAVLRSLPVLLQKQTANSDLHTMALRLGSDVPFFLHNTSAYAEGRGEILSYFPFALPYWIVLVYPNIHVSTPWAYNTLSKKRNGSFPERAQLKTFLPTDSLEKISALKNDFEEVVFEHFPEIQNVKTGLENFGTLFSLMSGSGSSVFGLFDDEQKAQHAVKHFAGTYFTHCTEPNFTLN